MSMQSQCQCQAQCQKVTGSKSDSLPFRNVENEFRCVSAVLSVGGGGVAGDAPTGGAPLRLRPLPPLPLALLRPRRGRGALPVRLFCPLSQRRIFGADFRGRFAKHRGEEVQIAQKTEREKEQRLADLIDQAKSEQSTQSQEERPPTSEGLSKRDESEARTDAECQDQEPTEDKNKLEAREPIASALVTSGGASGEVADAPEEAEGEAASDESLDLVDTSLLEQSESATSESKQKSRTKCTLCSEMVQNILYSQKNHAALHHLKLPIYACAVCSFTSSSLNSYVIKMHVQRNHQNQENAGTKLWNTMLDSKKEAISKATKNCFPGANASWRPRPLSMIHLKKGIRQYSCEICGKSVRSNFRNTKNSYFVEHVTRHHWKIVLHSCKLCPFYTSTCWHKGGIRDHLKAAHKAQPSPDTFHSALGQHRDAIAHLVDQCFPPI